MESREAKFGFPVYRRPCNSRIIHCGVVIWRYSNSDDVQNYRASTRFLNFELSLYNDRVPVERPSYLLYAYVYQSQCKLDSEWEGRTSTGLNSNTRPV